MAEQLDPTADLVVQALADRGVPVVRFDLAEFPAALTLAAEHGGELPGWRGRLCADRRVARLEEVRAVYYRRPGLPVLSPRVPDAYREWARSQALVGMVQLLTSLPVAWIHHPDVYRAAAHKPGQLVTATTAGLTVPRSYLGNCLESAREWGRSLGGELVCKPVAAASIDLPGEPPLMLPTRPLHVSELDESLELTAHYLQERVPKAYEVRLTVVGRRLFPVAIHARSAAAREDWRSDYGALEYEVVDVPRDVAAAVFRFMAAHQLNFGAFDFAVRPDGRWVFFECNPAGQWQFVAQACRLPVAEAHASLLQGATT
ncbi:MvdC/MvdD family ATP grasp protein [Streptomyces sp. SM12]|uniref:MvdC/MvdD family ATP grasp protein n=1 Tax=Streptomyces sp. SM12 TaxID=1071602 RepID=UPI0011AFFE33|nr:ATP-grasp ribosomal peptide maturase [Streptomyces sp. SM12]